MQCVAGNTQYFSNRSNYSSLPRGAVNYACSRILDIHDLLAMMRRHILHGKVHVNSCGNFRRVGIVRAKHSNDAVPPPLTANAGVVSTRLTVQVFTQVSTGTCVFVLRSRVYDKFE